MYIRVAEQAFLEDVNMLIIIIITIIIIRVAEQAFLEDVNGLKPGSEWDRVAKNCDFNSKVMMMMMMAKVMMMAMMMMKTMMMMVMMMVVVRM